MMTMYRVWVASLDCGYQFLSFIAIGSEHLVPRVNEKKSCPVCHRECRVTTVVETGSGKWIFDPVMGRMTQYGGRGL
jgi:hypothetical protein